MASATTVRLVLSSEVRLVDVVHAASEAMAGIAGFQEDDALSVGIAVREAVINAIVHGNQMDRSRKVEVVLQARRTSIHARVRDHGAGFDSAATPDPTAGDNVLKSSGRGILVMRGFMDTVDFTYREGRGTEVLLMKRRANRDVTSSAGPSVAAMDNGGIER